MDQVVYNKYTARNKNYILFLNGMCLPKFSEKTQNISLNNIKQLVSIMWARNRILWCHVKYLLLLLFMAIEFSLVCSSPYPINKYE